MLVKMMCVSCIVHVSREGIGGGVGGGRTTKFSSSWSSGIRGIKWL